MYIYARMIGCIEKWMQKLWYQSPHFECRTCKMAAPLSPFCYYWSPEAEKILIAMKECTATTAESIRHTVNISEKTGVTWSRGCLDEFDYRQIWLIWVYSDKYWAERPAFAMKRMRWYAADSNLKSLAESCHRYRDGPFKVAGIRQKHKLSMCLWNVVDGEVSTPSWFYLYGVFIWVWSHWRELRRLLSWQRTRLSCVAAAWWWSSGVLWFLQNIQMLDLK